MENLPLSWEEVEAILKQIPDLKPAGVKTFFNQGLFYKIRFSPGEIVMPKGVHSDFAAIHLSGGYRVFPDDPPAALMDAPVLDCWRRPGPRIRRLTDWVLDRTDRIPPPEPVKEGEEPTPPEKVPAGERFRRFIARRLRHSRWFKNRLDRRLAEVQLASPMLDDALKNNAWTTTFAGLTLRSVNGPDGQLLPLFDRLIGLTSALWNEPRGVTLVADSNERRTGAPCEMLLIKRTALLKIDELSATFRNTRVQQFMRFDLPRICSMNKLFEDLVDAPTWLNVIGSLKGLHLDFKSKGTEIFRQGDEATGLSLIVSGTIRVSREGPGGTSSLNYLVKNQYFGIASIFENVKRSATLSAVTDVALLTFPTEEIRKVCAHFPGLRESLREEWRNQARVDYEAERGKLRPPANPPEHLVQKLLQGRNLLLIDMDLCTRCDQCVRACAAAHDDVPRFHRANPDLRFGKWEVAAACVHCVDAPCQQACPVGAITFLPNGMVHIHRSRCIGCQSCVDPCPFDVIEMLTRSSPEEAPVTKANKGYAVATKCDLCLTETHDPPCVASCPYGAAQRGAPDELFPNIGQLNVGETVTISKFGSSMDMKELEIQMDRK